MMSAGAVAAVEPGKAELGTQANNGLGNNGLGNQGPGNPGSPQSFDTAANRALQDTGKPSWAAPAADSQLGTVMKSALGSLGSLKPHVTTKVGDSSKAMMASLTDSFSYAINAGLVVRSSVQATSALNTVLKGQ